MADFFAQPSTPKLLLPSQKFLPTLPSKMGNCSASTVNSESTELQVASAQKHPSLMTLAMRTNMKFGWRPDMPDHRDLRVTFDKVDAPSHIKRKAEGDLFGNQVTKLVCRSGLLQGFCGAGCGPSAGVSGFAS